MNCESLPPVKTCWFWRHCWHTVRATRDALCKSGRKIGEVRGDIRTCCLCGKVDFLPDELIDGY